MIDIENIRIGDLLQVNKDGLCIKKGTIVEIRGINADDTLPAKGLTGSLSCRPLDDTQFDGGIWAAYLDPIPITEDFLKKNGFALDNGFGEMKDYPRYVWCDKNADANPAIVSVRVYRMPIGGVRFLTKCESHSRHEDGLNNFHSCDVENIHQLQHLAKECGIKLHVKP